MSSVKMTRLFAKAGYGSFEICVPNSPIHKALEQQGLMAKTTVPRKYFSPGSTLAIRRWLVQENVKALYLHSMRDIWLVTPALLGLPHIKLFGFARMFFKDVNKKDMLHRLMYGRLTKMIALSHIQAGYLERCLPVPRDKFIVIPNGVDIQRFQPLPLREDIRSSWGVTKNQILFGLIGRLDIQKGSMEFVEAAAKVLQTQPEARFVMVGGNTLGQDGFDLLIHKRLTELGVKDKVILTDFRTDIPEVMNALDVFVMPSYEENFANVLLEALASGLPCIGTNSGGTPEILENAGLLCEPRSADSLAQSMSKLLNSPNLRSQLATKARQKAAAVYDMEKVFSRIMALAIN